jgi:hypothetical protein
MPYYSVFKLPSLDKSGTKRCSMAYAGKIGVFTTLRTSNQSIFLNPMGG